MSAESDVARHRKSVTDLQTKISKESGIVAQARKRAAAARIAATRTRSTSTINSKLTEAQREEKKAIDAETRRATLEGQLARTQQDLYKAETRLTMERSDEQAKAQRALERSIRERESQFQPSDFARPTRAFPLQPPAPPAAEPVYDVFISHASEDKDEIARPLAERLTAEGIRVWFDANVLTVGDSLRQKIDEGLAASRYGLVILSPSFFKKDWPKAELDGLYARQTNSGQKVILPIWHRVSKDEVTAASPLLAGMLAIKTADSTLDEIVTDLLQVLRPETDLGHGESARRAP